MTRREEVLQKMCAIMTDVKDNVFHNMQPADCICGTNPLTNARPDMFQFSDQVLEYIEQAVKEKMAR